MFDICYSIASLNVGFLEIFYANRNGLLCDLQQEYAIKKKKSLK